MVHDKVHEVVARTKFDDDDDDEDDDDDDEDSVGHTLKPEDPRNSNDR